MDIKLLMSKTYFRLLVSFFAAITIVFGLFWGLQGMINVGTNQDIKSDNSGFMDFISLKKEQNIIKKERVKPKKPKPKKKPLKPKININKTVKAVKQPIKMENLDLDLPLNLNANSALGDAFVSSGGRAISTSVIPISRIDPRYPRRAKRMRKEGFVTLEFTITKQGTVKDVVVVESAPEGVFEQSAKRAILKWRFRAKMEEGEAIEQRAMLKIEFKLDK